MQASVDYIEDAMNNLNNQVVDFKIDSVLSRTQNKKTLIN